jgi:hypothetical protein
MTPALFTSMSTCPNSSLALDQVVRLLSFCHVARNRERPTPVAVYTPDEIVEPVFSTGSGYDRCSFCG